MGYSITVTIFTDDKPKPRQVKQLSQGYRANKWLDGNSNVGCLALDSMSNC